MRYVRDVAADDPAAIDAERAHVIAHLSAVTSPDDDPERNAGRVADWLSSHPTDDSLIRIVGEIDADPVAPYLQPGYDPLAEVDPDLFASEVSAAVADEEALRG